MRVTEVRIEKWRNIRGVVIKPPVDASLVCLVGENGTGKSGILELLADAFKAIGIRPLEAARSGPRTLASRDMQADIVIDVAPWDRTDYLRHDFHGDIRILDAADRWDQTFTVSYRGAAQPEVIVGNLGADEYAAQAIRGGWHIVPENRLDFGGWRTEESCLFLGPDRYFLPTRSEIELIHAPAPDIEPSWGTIGWHWVGELVGSFLADERSWTQETLRRAQAGETTFAPFPERRTGSPFEGFEQLLPHLGVPHGASNANDIVFDSPTGPIEMSDLSSGEKDVLLTALYLERFREAAKVLLIDEPELHLHPDLARRRLEHMRDHNAGGQTWIATHAYEAIEVASPSATFVLSRTSDGLVHDSRAWDEQGAAGLLAMGMGWPSIPSALTRFVFIEQHPEARRPSRIPAVAGFGDTHLVASGGGSEVRARIRHLTETARSEPMLSSWRIGGVVDRDFMDETERDTGTVGERLYVLDCHEEENLFLDPASIDYQIAQERTDGDEAAVLI